MRKVYYILAAVIVLMISGYLYIRLVLLKTKTDHQMVKSQSVLDLRPLMINKLDELVKEGSDSLYTLSIGRLEPDIARSSIDLFDVTLVPDSAAIKRLDSLKKLPDDIFRISFHRLHITRISAVSIINNEKIDIDTILLSDPIIRIYHKAQAYNQEQRREQSTKTLYQKLTTQFKNISVKAIIASNGTLINSDVRKKKSSKFDNVSINITDLLIDSTTQFDTTRVLFSKEVSLASKNYLLRTADSLYTFKIDAINVFASKHSMIATGVALLPRGNKQQFERKLAKVQDRFTVHFPKIVFTNIDWWHLMNSERFVCDEVDIHDAEIDDYLDRSLPHSSKITVANFPSQSLLQLPLKVNIGRLNMHNAKVIYEEFAPESGQSGTIYFTSINGSINNMTNVSAEIKRHHTCTASATGLFMKKVPMKGKLNFDLSKKDGSFSADLEIDSIDKTVINPVGEPLGMITLNSGIVHHGTSHIEGNNFNASAKVLMIYSDLRLTPLKKDGKQHKLKERSLLGFLANTFVLRKNNPNGDKPPKSVEVTMERGHHGNFFNFLWGTIRKGILKSIGAPAP